MSLIDSLEEYTLAVYERLDSNKSLVNVEDVYLGDQERVPRTPCLTVEPGTHSRDYNGAPRRVAVSFEAYIMVYVQKIQDSAANVKLLLATVKLVEQVLHADNTLGKRVISSYVAEVEPGYATRDKTLMRAARLTFRAASQKMLPYP